MGPAADSLVSASLLYGATSGDRPQHRQRGQQQRGITQRPTRSCAATTSMTSNTCTNVGSRVSNNPTVGKDKNGGASVHSTSSTPGKRETKSGGTPAGVGGAGSSSTTGARQSSRTNITNQYHGVKSTVPSPNAARATIQQQGRIERTSPITGGDSPSAAIMGSARSKHDTAAADNKKSDCETSQHFAAVTSSTSKRGRGSSRGDSSTNTGRISAEGSSPNSRERGGGDACPVRVAKSSARSSSRRASAPVASSSALDEETKETGTSRVSRSIRRKADSNPREQSEHRRQQQEEEPKRTHSMPSQRPLLTAASCRPTRAAAVVAAARLRHDNDSVARAVEDGQSSATRRRVSAGSARAGISSVTDAAPVAAAVSKPSSRVGGGGAASGAERKQASPGNSGAAEVYRRKPVLEDVWNALGAEYFQDPRVVQDLLSILMVENGGQPIETKANIDPSQKMTGDRGGPAWTGPGRPEATPAGVCGWESTNSGSAAGGRSALVKAGTRYCWKGVRRPGFVEGGGSTSQASGCHLVGVERVDRARGADKVGAQTNGCPVSVGAGSDSAEGVVPGVDGSGAAIPSTDMSCKKSSSLGSSDSLESSRSDAAAICKTNDTPGCVTVRSDSRENNPHEARTIAGSKDSVVVTPAVASSSIVRPQAGEASAAASGGSSTKSDPAVGSNIPAVKGGGGGPSRRACRESTVAARLAARVPYVSPRAAAAAAAAKRRCITTGGAIDLVGTVENVTKSTEEGAAAGEANSTAPEPAPAGRASGGTPAGRKSEDGAGKATRDPEGGAGRLKSPQASGESNMARSTTVPKDQHERAESGGGGSDSGDIAAGDNPGVTPASKGAVRPFFGSTKPPVGDRTNGGSQQRSPAARLAACSLRRPKEGKETMDEVSFRLATLQEALGLLEEVAIRPALGRVADAVQIGVDGRAEDRAKNVAAIRIERAWRAVSHVKSRGRTKRRARTESFCSLSSSYSATDIPAQPARKSGGIGDGDSPATVRNKKRRLLEQRRRIPPEQEKRGKPSTTESSVSLSSSSTGAGALLPPSGLSCDSKERGSTTAATASPSMSRARNRTTPPSPLETAGRADASVGHERKRPASKHDAAAALPGSSSKRSKRSGRAESGVLPRGPPLRGFSKGVLALDKAPGADGGGSDSSAGHDERNPARRAGSGAGGSGSSTVPISSGGGRSVNKMSRNVHGGLHSDRGRNRADDGKRHSCREFDCARRAHFGTPGWVPVHCVEHRRDWEVFLKYASCLAEGCVERPAFGIPGDHSRVYCRRHRIPGAVTLASAGWKMPDGPRYAGAGGWVEAEEDGMGVPVDSDAEDDSEEMAASEAAATAAESARKAAAEIAAAASSEAAQTVAARCGCGGRDESNTKQASPARTNVTKSTRVGIVGDSKDQSGVVRDDRCAVDHRSARGTVSTRVGGGSRVGGVRKVGPKKGGSASVKKGKEKAVLTGVKRGRHEEKEEDSSDSDSDSDSDGSSDGSGSDDDADSDAGSSSSSSSSSLSSSSDSDSESDSDSDSSLSSSSSSSSSDDDLSSSDTGSTSSSLASSSLSSSSPSISSLSSSSSSCSSSSNSSCGATTSPTTTSTKLPEKTKKNNVNTNLNDASFTPGRFVYLVPSKKCDRPILVGKILPPTPATAALAEGDAPSQPSRPARPSSPETVPPPTIPVSSATALLLAQVAALSGHHATGAGGSATGATGVAAAFAGTGGVEAIIGGLRGGAGAGGREGSGSGGAAGAGDKKCEGGSGKAEGSKNRVSEDAKKWIYVHWHTPASLRRENYCRGSFTPDFVRREGAKSSVWAPFVTKIRRSSVVTTSASLLKSNRIPAECLKELGV